MSEVTSVNGHTGAVVLTAADVEAVPTSAEGKPSGVATLDSSGVLHEAQLPAPVEISSPAPTEVAATDTANVEAALTAAAGGLCKLTRPGTYSINKGLVLPVNTSLFIGPNTTLKATSAIAGPLLSTPQSECSRKQSILGGGIIDANGLAQNALWLRYFQRNMTVGVICQNSTQHTVILGDPEAPAGSDEAHLTEQFMVDRTSGSVPVGYYGLWIRRCSDGTAVGCVVTGQQTGVRVDSSNWKFYGVHPYGAGFPMNTCFDDNELSEYHGCCADTPTPLTHGSATGEAASTTITDTAILGQHQGLPVSGTNIPAGSYVGAVTSGVSFVLANSGGVGVNPTGAVSGITLAGVGWMLRRINARIIGGTAYISPTYGTDNAAYGVLIGAGVQNVFIVGLLVEGGSGSVRYSAPLIGNLSSSTWVGLLQNNCVNFNSAQSQISSIHGATLKLTNTVSSDFLEAATTAGTTIAKIDTNGNVTSTKGIAVFSHAAPGSQHAAITSPAAELAALKIAVDALREVLKEYGLTA
jgi:hypothetical protein